MDLAKSSNVVVELIIWFLPNSTRASSVKPSLLESLLPLARVRVYIMKLLCFYIPSNIGSKNPIFNFIELEKWYQGLGKALSWPSSCFLLLMQW